MLDFDCSVNETPVDLNDFGVLQLLLEGLVRGKEVEEEDGREDFAEESEDDGARAHKGAPVLLDHEETAKKPMQQLVTERKTERRQISQSGKGDGDAAEDDHGKRDLDQDWNNIVRFPKT